jgi:hypothetical protein
MRCHPLVRVANYVSLAFSPAAVFARISLQHGTHDLEAAVTDTLALVWLAGAEVVGGRD